MLRPRQIDTAHSKAYWQSQKRATQDVVHTPSDKELAEQVEHLTLPKMEAAPGVQNRDFWRAQTYAKFARQLQRKNPDAMLTKHVAVGMYDHSDLAIWSQ
jgi:hypothetical protein